ncbi:MAG: hypothetical protein DRI89_11725 [Bacteroidetes bacterium]|nr:MAG: hypothetical protein DRI89_11725 [Bacteroidota bacterium]
MLFRRFIGLDVGGVKIGKIGGKSTPLPCGHLPEGKTWSCLQVLEKPLFSPSGGDAKGRGGQNSGRTTILIWRIVV